MAETQALEGVNNEFRARFVTRVGAVFSFFGSFQKTLSPPRALEKNKTKLGTPLGGRNLIN